MKKILLIIFLVIFSCFVSAESPKDIKLSGFVNDYAGVLSLQEEQQIADVLKTLYDNKIAQVAVVTVKNLGGLDESTFAYQVAEGKLGVEDKNNGLLILVAIDDRRYRFEVGRGIEPILNDAKVGRFGRTYFVQNFKDENYAEGLYQVVLAISNELDPGFEIQPSARYSAMDSAADDAFGATTSLVFFIIIMIIVLVALRKNRKGRSDNDFFTAALLGSMFMRGGRGGFGGGGFGGFGGGGFGGGGSGGGW